MENNHKNYYVKIYSSGRVTCKNVYMGIIWGGQKCYLTGTGTGEAQKYKTTSDEAYYHLIFITSDYKLRDYKGRLILDGKDLCADNDDVGYFSASLSKDCKTITTNGNKYTK